MGVHPASEDLRRTTAIGLVNVLVAAVAAAGQWASWRTENEFGLDVPPPEAWRVVAVFAATFVPAAVAVLLAVRVLRVWRLGWRGRIAATAALALVAALVRLGLLLALRTSRADVWFLAVETGFGLAVVVIAVALSLWALDVRERLRREEEARSAQERRATEALASAENAELEVRRQVADELHGSLQQRLVVASAHLGDVAVRVSDGVAEELRGLASELDDVRERHVRELSHAVLPTSAEIGLREAIHLGLGRLPPAVSSEVTITPGMAANMSDPTFPRLGLPERLLLVGVVQEALTNAVRHGRAHRVAVHLDAEMTGAESAVLLVRVENDGAPPPAQPRLSGLGTLRRRLAERGGSLRLEAGGLGVTLVATLPVQHLQGRLLSPRVASP